MRRKSGFDAGVAKIMSQDYLTLRSTCLKHSDKWSNEGRGLCFVFPTAGVGKYRSGILASRLMPGDVLVFDKAGEAGTFVSTEDELVLNRFSVSFEHLYPLFAIDEICLLRNAAESFQKAKLYSASTPLAVECHRLIREVPSEFNLVHRSQLLRIVAAILCEELDHARSRRVGYVRIEDHLTQVFEKLTVDELLTSSVGALADKFSCSRRHLNRLFHQHIGLSVAALRMELRMLKAGCLLRDPDAKVINIAQECGFNHLGLFNTCFRKRFGASPGQWRKLTTQAEAQTAGLIEVKQIRRSSAMNPGAGNLPDLIGSVGREDRSNGSASRRSNRVTQPPVEAVEVFEVMPGIKIRLHS